MFLRVGRRHIYISDCNALAESDSIESYEGVVTTNVLDVSPIYYPKFRH